MSDQRHSSSEQIYKQKDNQPNNHSNENNEMPIGTTKKIDNCQDDLEAKVDEIDAALDAPMSPVAVTAKDQIPDNDLPPITRQSTSGRPYSSFTSKQKALIVLVATIGSCFSGFTSNIYFPAIDTISNALDVSVSEVNLSITTFMIFQGIAPSFISAVADVKGRRPGYLIGSIFYIAANLGLALNNSYVGLMILRCVQSCGSSGMVTLAQGTIADVVTSAERGKYISITSISGVLAPSVAPIVGGVLAQRLGWHSVFWFLLIAAGVYFVPLLLLFPETCRAVVGDGTIPPPKWNRCLLNLNNKTDSSDAEKGNLDPAAPAKPRKPINPLASLTILRDPETALLLTYISVAYAAFYAISSSITVQFGRLYHLSSTLQGLLFLPQAIGSLLAAITNSRVLDANWRRHSRKLGLDYSKTRQTNILSTKLPVEKARLDVGLPMAIIPAIMTIIYGWLLEARVSIAGPIVVMVCLGYTTLCSFSVVSVLVIDLHRSRASTASAASNLSRCLCGAGAAAVVNPMINAMGNGWTFTIWGVLQMSALPGLWYVYANGGKLRAARLLREERQRAAEEERQRSRDNGKAAKRSWLRKVLCLGA